MWPGKYNALSTPVDICQIKSRARSKDPWHASARSPGASQSHSGCTVVFAVLAGLRPLGLGAVTAPWEQPTSISSHVKYLATFDSIEIELTEGSLGKFRSQTSDNMDRRKSRGGKSQRREEKRGEEKKGEDQRRERVRRKKVQRSLGDTRRRQGNRSAQMGGKRDPTGHSAAHWHLRDFPPADADDLNIATQAELEDAAAQMSKGSLLNSWTTLRTQRSNWIGIGKQAT